MSRIICQWGKIISLFIILFLSIRVSLQACPECGCKNAIDSKQEYINLISLHPSKNKLIRQGNYNFFVTISEPAPDTFDIFFYIENSMLKRPIRTPKEILIYNDDLATPERFILESDIIGASSLRYVIRKSFKAKMRISAVTPDKETISAETVIQVGSPKPSFTFLTIFGFAIIASISVVFIRKHLSSGNSILN